MIIDVVVNLCTSKNISKCPRYYASLDVLRLQI